MFDSPFVLDNLPEAIHHAGVVVLAWNWNLALNLPV
jgi:hypothetical protein